MTTASASLGTIVVINENNDDGLTTLTLRSHISETRHGAAFDRKETVITSLTSFDESSVSWYKDTIVLALFKAQEEASNPNPNPLFLLLLVLPLVPQRVSWYFLRLTTGSNKRNRQQALFFLY
jgi:hypothetical protein